MGIIGSIGLEPLLAARALSLPNQNTDRRWFHLTRLDVQLYESMGPSTTKTAINVIRKFIAPRFQLKVRRGREDFCGWGRVEGEGSEKDLGLAASQGPIQIGMRVSVFARDQKPPATADAYLDRPRTQDQIRPGGSADYHTRCAH